MRAPAIRRPPSRTATAVEKTFPAPVGGWNARDSLASMRPTDAVELVNWFPRPSYVEMRPGCTPHMTAFPSTVKTLAVYRKTDGTQEFFAFTADGVHEATFGGQNNGSTIVARTNGKHQWDNFGDGTNNWLIAFNGVDKPFYWNGTTYTLVDGASSPAITGITTTEIVSCAVFKERLFLIRNNTLEFDYLPAGVVGGAASTFNLASIASLGGYLMAMAVWTRDAGNGPDDYAVFLTSEGEALVYAGTDPNSATTWSLVGTFRISKPLGRRCVLKYGADPIILTQSGAFPLSSLLASGDERQKFALSFKIQNAFSQAAAENFDTFGWCMVSFTEQDAIIVNRPRTEDGPHEQYVMNTISKAWCKFIGWHAEDFVVFDRDLYFCRGSSIYRAWTGVDQSGNPMTSDNGDAITYSARQAYQDFGIPSKKKPVLFQPIMQANKLLNYSTGIDVEFEDREQFAITTVAQSDAFRWDVSSWDEAKWASANNIIQQWSGTACWPGRWLSGKLKIVSDSVSGQWLGSVMRFIPGSGL
ncbi:MAG: hypothetical protein OJF50_002453 [Nitrospira sp.]|nr:hypothetical protein [Nitrospira sp.]